MPALFIEVRFYRPLAWSALCLQPIDLNDKNILCGIIPLDAYDKKKKYELLGRPKKDCVQSHEGEGEIVRPAVFPGNLLSGSVSIADFGISIKAGTSVNHKPQSPRGFCAPERLHDRDPSAASDMWSYMCIFSKLYLGHLPWLDGGGPGLVIEVLGPLPKDWQGSYFERDAAPDSWYDPETQPKETLRFIIACSRPGITLDEIETVLSFMLKGFHYHPEQRITAAQLLSDESFQAIMKRYGA